MYRGTIWAKRNIFQFFEDLYICLEFWAKNFWLLSKLHSSCPAGKLKWNMFLEKFCEIVIFRTSTEKIFAGVVKTTFCVCRRTLRRKILFENLYNFSDFEPATGTIRAIWAIWSITNYRISSFRLIQYWPYSQCLYILKIWATPCRKAFFLTFKKGKSAFQMKHQQPKIFDYSNKPLLK